LGGCDTGSNSFTLKEFNVGFVILSLEERGFLDPWESFVKNTSGGLEISSSGNFVFIGFGSSSIGAIVGRNAGSVSGLGSLLCSDGLFGGSLRWYESFVGVTEWVLRVSLNSSSLPSDSTSPLLSSWVNVLVSDSTLGLNISSVGNMSLQSISSIGVGSVFSSNISGLGGLECLLSSNN